MTPADYCRAIEAYLCRKNDGHLIRIVGPAFETVSAWATRGVPLKVAYQGIDGYFERHAVKAVPAGGRRRPVRIEFCEADVLDAFDAWRRAVGVSATQVANGAGADMPGRGESPPPRRAGGLRAHVDRAMVRLTQRRLDTDLPSEVTAAIDRTLAELDALRTESARARGSARTALLESLARLDRALTDAARTAIDPDRVASFEREARDELAPYSGRLPADELRQALDALARRLLRSELRLPQLTLE